MKLRYRFACCLLIVLAGCGTNHEQVWQEHYNRGWAAYQKGRYVEAERLLKSAIDDAKKFGDQDVRMAQSLDRLAWVYHEQAKDAQAEPLAKRSIDIATKKLGAEHETVGILLNTLAAIYQGQGRFEEAEKLHHQAIAIAKKTKGDDHPQVANSLNNLASLYSAQEKFGEAEARYREALAIRERSLPPDHPDIGRSLHNLANVLKSQQRYDEAEPVYQQARMNLESALPKEHEHVAICREHSADLYFQRAVESLSLGSETAATDATKFLDLQGWRHELSQNMVLIAYFATRCGKKDEAARELLEFAAEKCDPTWWPYPVIRFLRNEISSEELDELASDDDKKTEVNAYVGMFLLLEGESARATDRLNWVKEHGNRSFIEYQFATAVLSRGSVESKEAPQPAAEIIPQPK